MNTKKAKQINSNIELVKDSSGIYHANIFNPLMSANLYESNFRVAKKKALELERLLTKSETAISSENATHTKNLNERKIINGNIILFKRARSRNWQAKIRIGVGRWKDYSTRQRDFEQAKKAAEEIYRDLKWRQETGKVAVSKRFKDVCLVAKKELDAEYKLTKKAQAKDKARVIEKYLIPLLGNYYTHRITAEVLVEFEDKREALAGKKLTRSTINTHNSALNYCFNLARKHNYLNEIPQLSNTGKNNRERREYFDDTEYRKLTAFMWREVERAEKRINTDGFDIRSYETQAVLRDIVLILANTGIRCGNELLNLRWCDIEVRKHKQIGEFLVFNLRHTKTRKPRAVISYEPHTKQDGKRYGSWSCLERIKNRFTNLAKLDLEKCFESRDYIFRLPSTKKVVRQDVLSRNFKKWLSKANLLVDKFGVDRTLYSLRHTYASRRRKEGMSYEDLALNMGTSVVLLEKVYSQFKQIQAPARFTGHAYRDIKAKLKLND